MKQFNNVAMKKGFTLIELLVVVAIIAILSAVGISTFAGAQKKARDARRRADLKAIQNAMEQAYIVNGYYGGLSGTNTYNYYYLLPSTSWAGTSCRTRNEPVDPLFSEGSDCFLYDFDNAGNSSTLYRVCADLETMDGNGNRDYFEKTNHYDGEPDVCVSNLQ